MKFILKNNNRGAKMKFLILAGAFMLMSTMVWAGYAISKDGDKIKITDTRIYPNGQSFAIEKSVLSTEEIQRLQTQKTELDAARQAKLDDIEKSITHILRMKAEAEAIATLTLEIETQIAALQKPLDVPAPVDPVIVP